MIGVSELLEPEPRPWWKLLRQVGVEHVVSFLPGGEQGLRWLALTPGGSFEPWEVTRGRIPPPGRRSWDPAGLDALVDLYRKEGFELVGLEDTPPMDLVRLGRPGRDEQIEWFIDMLRAMAAVGLGFVCYNWLAVGTWARTATDRPERGGALVSAFRRSDLDGQPPLLGSGDASHESLWENLEHFLGAVVPVAEEVGVNLGLHPDDPPIPEVRGIPRIITSLEAYDRVLQAHASARNGITLCQGNFALMTDDIPAAIQRYAGRTHFVHFRDVRGSAEDFQETFHDNGPTDLLACMRAYRDSGYHGFLRPDHVPTLDGEPNDKPGYAVLGRLHAVGYINGLREAAYGKDPRYS